MKRLGGIRLTIDLGARQCPSLTRLQSPVADTKPSHRSTGIFEVRVTALFLDIGEGGPAARQADFVVADQRLPDEKQEVNSVTARPRKARTAATAAERTVNSTREESWRSGLQEGDPAATPGGEGVGAQPAPPRSAANNMGPGEPGAAKEGPDGSIIGYTPRGSGRAIPLDRLVLERGQTAERDSGNAFLVLLP